MTTHPEVPMNALLIHLAADPPPKPPSGWTINGAINNLLGLGALVLSLLLVAVAVMTIKEKYRSGDMSGSMNTLGVVVIGLAIAALGVGGVALLYGASILSAATSLLG
jgi:hypothetical protein